jgi:hypothetical protein
MDEDLLRILYDAGFTDKDGLSKAYAIAKAESNGRPRAHNTDASTGDNSYGMFQINMIDSLGPARDQKFGQKIKGYKNTESLFDPTVNARTAAYMSKKGKDWSSWSTYGSDRYNNAMPNSSAVGRLINQWSFVPNVPSGAQTDTGAGVAKAIQPKGPVKSNVVYTGPKGDSGTSGSNTGSTKVTNPGALEALKDPQAPTTAPSRQFSTPFTGATIASRVF